MIKHHEEYALIKDSQHGFIRNKSCLTNLLIFMEEATNYLDSGFPAVRSVTLNLANKFSQCTFRAVPEKTAPPGGRQLHFDHHTPRISYYPDHQWVRIFGSINTPHTPDFGSLFTTPLSGFEKLLLSINFYPPVFCAESKEIANNLMTQQLIALPKLTD